MRVGELKNSRIDGDFIIITKTKGRKERIIPIPDEYIRDYEIAVSNLYSESWISHSFSRLIKECKLDSSKTLHSLRHTFGYKKLIELKNIQIVRDLMGHSSVTVTEIYTQIPQEYLKQMFRKNAVKRDTEWIQS